MTYFSRCLVASTSTSVPLCSRISTSVTKLLTPNGPWDPYPRSGYSKRLLSIDCTSCFFVIFTHTNSLSRICARCHHPFFKEVRFLYLFNFWCVLMGSSPKCLKRWDNLVKFIDLIIQIYSRCRVLTTTWVMCVHTSSRVSSSVTKLLTPMVPEFWTLDQGALDTWHRYTVSVILARRFSLPSY